MLNKLVCNIFLLLLAIVVGISCGNGGTTVDERINSHEPNSLADVAVDSESIEISENKLVEDTLFNASKHQYKSGDYFEVVTSFSLNKNTKRSKSNLANEPVVHVEIYIDGEKVGSGKNGESIEVETNDNKSGVFPVQAKLIVDGAVAETKNLGNVTLSEPIKISDDPVLIKQSSSHPQAISIGGWHFTNSTFKVEKAIIVTNKNWETILVSRKIIKKNGKWVRVIEKESILNKNKNNYVEAKTRLVWDTKNKNKSFVTEGNYDFLHFAKVIKRNKNTNKKKFIAKSKVIKGVIKVEKDYYTTAELSAKQLNFNLAYNETQVKTFKLINKGEKDLNYYIQRKGTKKQYEPTIKIIKDNGKVAAGKQKTIKIEIKSKGAIHGNHITQLLVRVNDKENPVLKLKVKSTVQEYNLIAFSKTTLKFGDVLNTRPKTMPITIENPGTSSTTLNYIAFSTSAFKLNPEPYFPMEIPAYGSVDLNIEFSPKASSSVSEIMIVNSNASNGSMINVPLVGKGHVATGFTEGTLSEKSLSFSLDSGESTTSSVILKNEGLEDLNFSITPIPVENNQVSLKQASVEIINAQKPKQKVKDIFKSKHKAGELIVGYKNSGMMRSQGVSINQYGMKVKKVLSKAKNTTARSSISVLNHTKKNIVLLEGDKDLDLVKTRKLILQDPNVSYVEPNYIVHAIETPDDSYFHKLYAMNNTGQTNGYADADIDAVEAWGVFQGDPNLKIGVIDTGIDYTHPDLRDNIWVNPGEIANNGIDDDNNGYIDDVHGYDFGDDDSDPMDEHYHGTHCAGTIAAKGNNGVGVTGVVWHAKLVALKFLSEGGSGTLADALEAIMYANAMGISITSNSWGGGGYSQAMADVLNETNELGYLFVAAAGNDANNNNLFGFYPASYDIDSVMSVAATDDKDELAYFSNFGSNSVDLGAPGFDIYSTMLNGSYGHLNGTSMAAPHVAGVAAMLKGYSPHKSGVEIKQVILDSVDPIPSLSDKTITGGRLNAFNAIKSLSSRWFTIEPSAGTILGHKEMVLPIEINTAEVTSGQYMLNVMFEINSIDSPFLQLDVNLDVTGPAKIEIDQDQLGFDTVWVGREKTIPLMIKNVGSDPLVINAIDIENVEFSASNIDSLPITIDGFSRKIANITYVPSDSHASIGNLTIQSNAINTPVVNIPLEGRGVYPPNLELSHESLHVTLENGQNLSEYIQLSNTGESDLEYYITLIENVSPQGEVSINQFRGPDEYGYYWKDSNDPLITFEWNDISETGVRLDISDGDDDYEEVELTGFEFNFYGESHNSFFVGTNGYITFVEGSTMHSPESFPSDEAPSRAIAPFFNDLDPSTKGDIYVLEESDRCTIQFEQVEIYGSEGNVTFQAVIYKNGQIKFYYKKGITNTEIYAVGIQDGTTTIGLDIASYESYFKDGMAVEIKRHPKWLSMPVSEGTISPSSNEDLEINFNTDEVDVGSYSAVLRIATNYLFEPIDIPIEFNVTEQIPTVNVK